MLSKFEDNTLGVSAFRIDYAPNGQSPPHIHPRASEILLVLEGTLYAGFVTSDNLNNTLITKVLHEGDVFVFPIGLIHFHVNIGNTSAVAYSGLKSQFPGEITIADTIFGAHPRIKPDFLGKAFQLDPQFVSPLRYAHIYSGKLVHVPHCCFVNDYKQINMDVLDPNCQPKRSDYGAIFLDEYLTVRFGSLGSHAAAGEMRLRALCCCVLSFPFNYVDGKLNFDILYSDDPMKEYEERAVSLALDRQKLQALTNKLKSVRLTCPLFDTARWVKNLERSYFRLWSLHCSGQKPQHFKVIENDFDFPAIDR
ncbi:hypothetical protein WN944_016363 [Citrus x changshan-huyou]|uniref:Cupin type-1 domain-containing protein n=1 Tax=Citrus x changshan-huyou TaxID=2935761 RepID=A0AAP0MBH5_9ROSI